MRIFNRIIQDSKAPNTFDLWINKGKLKYFDGGWKDLGGSEQVSWNDIQDNPILSNGDGTKYLADDGTYKSIEMDGYLPTTGGIIKGNLTIAKYEFSTGYDPNIFIDRSTGVITFTNYNTSPEGGEDDHTTTKIGPFGIILNNKGDQDLLNANGGTTKLKTINSESLLGEGDINIVSSGIAVADTDATESATAQSVAATLNALLASLRASGAIQS